METGSGVFHTKINDFHRPGIKFFVIYPESGVDSDYQAISHNDITEDTYSFSRSCEILRNFLHGKAMSLETLDWNTDLIGQISVKTSNTSDV